MKISNTELRQYRTLLLFGIALIFYVLYNKCIFYEGVSLMALPNDPMILLSYINTQLRDNYKSFDELCKSMCVDGEEIKSTLSAIDYVYNEALNKFV